MNSGSIAPSSSSRNKSVDKSMFELEFTVFYYIYKLLQREINIMVLSVKTSNGSGVDRTQSPACQLISLLSDIALFTVRVTGLPRHLYND